MDTNKHYIPGAEKSIEEILKLPTKKVRKKNTHLTPKKKKRK